MNHSAARPQTVMVDDVTYHNIMNHSTAKPQTVMVDNTIYNQHCHEPLHHQFSNSNCGRGNLPQHHEPLHHQTSNSNGGQYNI
jgi:hypothetical protein